MPSSTKRKRKKRGGRKCHRGTVAELSGDVELREDASPDTRISNEQDEVSEAAIVERQGEALFPSVRGESLAVDDEVTWDDSNLVDAWYAEFGTTISRGHSAGWRIERGNDCREGARV